MKKTIIASFAIIIILFATYFLFLCFKKSNVNKTQNSDISEISTVKGEYRGTKGGGVVDGVYIPDSELEELSKYIGKTIEVKGILENYPCLKNEIAQCFNGPMMTKIQSIKEVNR